MGKKGPWKIKQGYFFLSILFVRNESFLFFFFNLVSGNPATHPKTRVTSGRRRRRRRRRRQRPGRKKVKGWKVKPQSPPAVQSRLDDENNSGSDRGERGRSDPRQSSFHQLPTAGKKAGKCNIGGTFSPFLASREKALFSIHTYKKSVSNAQLACPVECIWGQVYCTVMGRVGWGGVTEGGSEEGWTFLWNGK